MSEGIDRRNHTTLRILATLCITAAYISAILQGHNGILLAGYTNTVLIIVFVTPKQAKKLIDKWLKRKDYQINNEPRY